MKNTNINEGYRGYLNTLKGKVRRTARNAAIGWNAASKDIEDKKRMRRIHNNPDDFQAGILGVRSGGRMSGQRVRHPDETRKKVVQKRLTQVGDSNRSRFNDPQLKRAINQRMQKSAKARKEEEPTVGYQENPMRKLQQRSSTDIIVGARVALAEACWKGYKAKGMKKKGNRMVPNCVPESEDPRMKTTPASIQQGGGDPKVYKQEKAKKDPKPKPKKKSPTRRQAVGRGGGKYRRERIQPPKGHEGPSAPTRQVAVKGDTEGEQKKKFQKGKKEKPLSKKKVDRMGVRGQEKKIADKKKSMAKKTRWANIQAMKDMGVLKFDKEGKRIRR